MDWPKQTPLLSRFDRRLLPISGQRALIFPASLRRDLPPHDQPLSPPILITILIVTIVTAIKVVTRRRSVLFHVPSPAVFFFAVGTAIAQRTAVSQRRALYSLLLLACTFRSIAYLPLPLRLSSVFHPSLTAFDPTSSAFR